MACRGLSSGHQTWLAVKSIENVKVYSLQLKKSMNYLSSGGGSDERSELGVFIFPMKNGEPVGAT